MDEIHLEFREPSTDIDTCAPHDDETTDAAVETIEPDVKTQDDIDVDDFLLQQASKKVCDDDDDFDVDFNVRESDPNHDVESSSNVGYCPSPAELTPSRDVAAPSDDVIKVERARMYVGASEAETRDVLRTNAPKRWHGPEFDQANLQYARTEMSSVSAERVALEHINSPQVILQAQETTLKEDNKPSSKYGVVVRMSGSVEDLIYNVPAEDCQAIKALWEAVGTGDGDSEDEMDRLAGGGRKKISDIDFNEAMEHFRHSNTERYKYAIQPVGRAAGWKAIKRRFFSTKLHRDLVKDRDLFFCMAACPFDNAEPIHQRMLQTIYRRLTQARHDCPRYGAHWEHIGFQGNDPSTDLRSSGMLSLVMLIYLVTSTQLTTLSRNIFQLSLHWDQNFPFCLMSINMTRIIVQALRDGLLNKICNHEKNLFTVCHSLYVASYYHMYTIWRKQHKSIQDSGFVLQEVERFVRKNPRLSLKNLGDHLEGPQQAELTSLPVQAFTGVIELADKVAG